LGRDTNLCKGPVLFNLLPANYLWNDGTTNNFKVLNKPGSYWLKKSIGNCFIIDTIKIGACDSFKIYIPNSFTPNKDNINAIFKIEGIGILSVEITVFNRWGELVFKGEAWDGKYKGEICMQDVYTYIAKIKDVNGLVHYSTGLIHLLQ
jgi:gliding motility-associated-like protein